MKISRIVTVFTILSFLIICASYKQKRYTYHKLSDYESMFNAVSNHPNAIVDSLSWNFNSVRLSKAESDRLKSLITNNNKHKIIIRYFDYQPLNYSTNIAERRLLSIQKILDQFPNLDIEYHLFHLIASEEKYVELFSQRKRRLEILIK